MSWKSKVLALCAFFIVVFGAMVVACIVRPEAGVPILEYHMVNEKDTTQYNVPPAEFEEQMKYLKEQGYETISLLEYAKARKGKFSLPAKPIIITFDDGYVDNYTTALPILEKYGMKATMFMVVNDIGRKDYFSWQDLKAWQDRGMEIGSHTANHVDLTKLSQAQRQEEINASKLLMEWNGLKTIFFMAYPYGSYNQAVQDDLKANAYLGALTGKSGLNTEQTDMFVLHRTHIIKPKFGMLEFKWRMLKGHMCAKFGL